VAGFAALLRHENPPEGQSPLRAESIQAVVCHLLEALAAEKPTIWIIDELHHAPLESRQLILNLAQVVPGHRVLFVLASRPGLPEDEVAHLGRLENFRRVPVGRLSPREVVELLQEAFRSENLAERLSGRIAWKADGVPFFILEIVRDLKTSGQIETGSDGTVIPTNLIEEIIVPSAVRDLIGSRLRNISDEDRDLLDVAAVIGHEFDPGLVARVLERKRIRVLQRFSAIWRNAQILKPVGSRYRFDHNQIQEIIYAEIPESLLNGYHELIAQEYEEREDLAGRELAEIPPDSIVFLARHFLRGSDPKAGARYLSPALDHLSAANRSESVIELADLALAVEGLLPGPETVAVTMKMADALGFLGRREEQGVAARRAVDLAREAGDPETRAAARQKLGWYLWSIARYEEARTQFEKGIALAESAKCEEVRQGLLGNVSAALGMTGKYEEALEYARRANLDRASHSIGLYEQSFSGPSGSVVRRPTPVTASASWRGRRAIWRRRSVGSRPPSPCARKSGIRAGSPSPFSGSGR
jgi:tetratricopeptide (TPR) repeat protein